MGKINAGLVTSSSPHLNSNMTVQGAMRDVIIALIPILLVSILAYKGAALLLMIACVVTSCLAEVVVRKLQKREPTLHDCSAILTGLLIALLFPASASIWRAIIASIIAVALVKELVGGLGWNRFNPAVFGYVATIILGGWFGNIYQGFLNFGLDTSTQATPLSLMHLGLDTPGYAELFIFFPGGTLSETSVFAVLLGGIYLAFKRVINWRIPVALIATTFVLAAVVGEDPLYYILSGGIFMGALFMATDWVTSPINNRGKIVFAIFIGVLIVIFRNALPTTGGVAFSILIANAFVPMIERYTRHLPFSEPKGKASATGGKTVSG